MSRREIKYFVLYYKTAKLSKSKTANHSTCILRWVLQTMLCLFCKVYLSAMWYFYKVDNIGYVRSGYVRTRYIYFFYIVSIFPKITFTIKCITLIKCTSKCTFSKLRQSASRNGMFGEMRGRPIQIKC